MNIQMPKGYTLLANHKNEVVLAEAQNKEVPEPYVTWLVSNGTDTHTGCYFSDLKRAELSFCKRAFDVENGIKSDECTTDIDDVSRKISERIIETTEEMLEEQLRTLYKRSGKCGNDELSHLSESIILVSIYRQQLMRAKAPQVSNVKLFQKRVTRRGICINNESYWNEMIAMHHGETIQGIVSNQKLLIFDKNGVNLGMFELSTKS